MSESITASTIGEINKLSTYEKREIYTRLIPPNLFERFKLSPNLVDAEGNDLLSLYCPPGSSSIEMELRHQHGFNDPILYGHMVDTLNGQIHVLLYVLNDPEAPRFDIDILPNGTLTNFGTSFRNLDAEIAAMHYGLAPGQIRKGLRLLGQAIFAFEQFLDSIGHNLYFAEPLYYHNAYLFEKNGFSYEKGRRLMDRIQAGFQVNGDLLSKLDGSTPFLMPEAAKSIRLRSWAIHDGLLDEPFNNVTMYKRVGHKAGVRTCTDCEW
jgi:hypothetical protein